MKRRGNNFILPLIILAFFISSCGTSYDSSSDSGSIAFSVKWVGASTKKPSDGASGERYALDCAAAGVSTVEATVYDAADTILASGGPWNCDAHSGTVTGVSAGNNRKIQVNGRNSSGAVIYIGAQTGVTVTTGQTSDAGEITLTYVAGSVPSTPTGVSATAGDTQVTISWSAATGATSYNIYWSTSTGVTTSSGTKISGHQSASYAHTGLSNETTYYYIVTAVNAGGESPASSQTFATPTAAIGGGNGGGGDGVRKVPDTGQTTSYTTTSGEDSDYTINAPSYTDNGDDTVTDNITTLMWQKEDDDTTRTWADAGTYCDGLSLAGYSDWRLPDEFELMGIVNYETYGPTIDTTYFPNTYSAPYWSATTDASSSSSAWLVDFMDGYVSHYLSKSSLYHVRCVRGDATVPSFTDNGDNTVTDNVTSLMWQQSDDDTKRTWEDAITYCEGLTLAGYSDWRLPNVKESRSILDNTIYNPAINAAYFPNTNSADYWSSTTFANDTPNAWDVSFDNGGVNGYVKSITHFVRCVRGGS